MDKVDFEHTCELFIEGITGVKIVIYASDAFGIGGIGGNLFYVLFYNYYQGD